jgi:hypothetical protein
MKGKFTFSLKKCQKTSLHMKENERVLKIEKYFDFSKMDKKNVQKMDGEKVLTDQFFL